MKWSREATLFVLIIALLGAAAVLEPKFIP